MDSQSRQEYVKAAISFLQNPKLVDSSLKDKLKFLKDKGLSEVEVDEALNLALVNRHQTQGGRWNFIIILGLCLGGYRLYQTYLELERAKKEENKKTATPSPNISISPPLTIDGHLATHHTVTDQNNPTLSEILQRMTELKKLVELQRTNFGTEMQSLKTLLLGHEKFAAPPKIPEWQMVSPEKQVDKESQQSKTVTSVKKSKKGKGSDVSEQSSSKELFIEPVSIVPNLG